MKLHGNIIEAAVETLVIPRATGNLVFVAKAVPSYDAFNQLCPMPIPPVIQKRGEAAAHDVTDKDYLAKLEKWATAKTNWMILESLKATPGLEWDTVVPNDPDTWGNYEAELNTSGLSEGEKVRIVNLTVDANGLNEKKLDLATKAFLASTAAKPAGL